MRVVTLVSVGTTNKLQQQKADRQQTVYKDEKIGLQLTEKRHFEHTQKNKKDDKEKREMLE